MSQKLSRISSRSQRDAQQPEAHVVVASPQQASLVTRLSGLAILLTSLTTVSAQSNDPVDLETPLTRLRPINESSAVDQYHSRATNVTTAATQLNAGTNGRVMQVATPRRIENLTVSTAQWESTPFETDSGVTWIPANPSSGDANSRSGQPDADVRHTAMMQLQMPGGPGAPTTSSPFAPSDSTLVPPPSLGSSQPPISGTMLGPSTQQSSPAIIPMPSTMAPPGTTIAPIAPRTQPRGLPMSPAVPMNQGGFPSTQTIAPTISSSSDLLPVAPPQLNDQFATIDNCSCISPPSGYVAATGWSQPTPNFVATPPPTAYVTPAPVMAPAAIGNSVVIPDASMMPKGSGVPRHGLVNLGQTRNPVVVGQGIIGQPVAYVPGQPMRNWIRWVFP